ncbi:MAG: hypothetical protein ACR2MB_13655 [Acidimicrobiales bacterium]
MTFSRSFVARAYEQVVGEPITVVNEVLAALQARERGSAPAPIAS